MTTYRDIILRESRKLPEEIAWWPNYLYHFTDINHAVSIIDTGWIYGRTTVKQKHLTKTDAASQNVLSVTSEAVKQCGRLYMRPLTPTQFYSEGYKPKAVRHKDYKDANCPVPVFFLFDAVKTMEYPGVFFVERGAAGYKTEAWKTGVDAFSALKFDFIFHCGPTDNPEIFKQRRTEVLREGGIPLAGLLRRIVCRTPAEMQTLLALIRNRCPQKYDTYKSIITYASADVVSTLFMLHGIYVKAVSATKEQVLIEFNEPRLRYDAQPDRKKAVEIPWQATIYWKTNTGEIINNSICNSVIDYKKHAAISLHYAPYSMQFRLELYMDEEKHLLFCGEFNIDDHDIM